MIKSSIALLIGFAFAAPVFAQDAASGAGTNSSTTTTQSTTTAQPAASPSGATDAAGSTTTTVQSTTTSQPARSAAECDALLKKLDTNKDGHIMESAVASEPTIAAGFNDPTVKARGYMTTSEFTALCSGGKMPPAGN